MGIGLNKTKQQLNCLNMLNNMTGSMKQFEYNTYARLKIQLHHTEQKLQLLMEMINCYGATIIPQNTLLTIGFGDDDHMGRSDNEYQNCDYLIGKKYKKDSKYLCNNNDFNTIYRLINNLTQQNYSIRFVTYDINNIYQINNLNLYNLRRLNYNIYSCFLHISPDCLQSLILKYQIKKIFITNQIIEHFVRYNIMHQANKTSKKLILKNKQQYNRLSCQIQSEQNIWQNSLRGNN